MYNDINAQFKSSSVQLNNMAIFLAIPICWMIIYALFAFLFAQFTSEIWVAIVLGISIGLLILINFYIVILLSIRKRPDFSWKKICRVFLMIDLYSETVHNKDIKILIELLKEHGVNTRPKVLEVLRHYQCLIPRKALGGTHLFSILALTISTLALCFSDTFITSFQNQIITLVIIIMVLIIYALAYYFNKTVFKYFGESALYTRIESAVSEIWMKSLIK